MLHKNKLDEIAHLATQSLDYRKNDSVEIYRSIDKQNTGKYFGSDRTKEAEFEVLIFGYNVNFNNQIFIKYPDSDFYIEMYGGTGSSNGNMTECNIRNIIKEKVQPFIYEGVLQAEKNTILKHENYAVLNDKMCQFNFLKRVANFNTKTYGESSFGREYVDEMLTRKYIPLPDEKDIAYAYMTKDNDFIIVIQDSYNFSYETMRCFFGNFISGFKTFEIRNFQRYRDGGTTIFDVIINDKENKFFHPSCLSGNGTKVPTWNNEKIFEIPTDKLLLIIEGLGIKLAPKVNNK